MDQIAAEIVAGTFQFSAELEDIHLNIEARLTERIGEAGKRLHTARSRNDQVATDFKLWTMRASREAADGLRVLQKALVRRADGHADWIMPGFTHLQTAQPITLGHHLLAYVTMLERDRVRMIGAALEAAWECPLGAAALAGTSYKIDRDATAHALGLSCAGEQFAGCGGLARFCAGGAGEPLDRRRRIFRGWRKRSCCGRRRSSASRG